MDIGAWWATVHGVQKSQTLLSNLSLSPILGRPHEGFSAHVRCWPKATSPSDSGNIPAPRSFSKDKQLTSGARSIEHLQKLLEGSILLLIGALSTGEPEEATGEDRERPPALSLRRSGGSTSWKLTLLMAVRAGSQAASRSWTNSWMLLEMTLQVKHTTVVMAYRATCEWPTNTAPCQGFRHLCKPSFTISSETLEFLYFKKEWMTKRSILAPPSF